MKKALIVGLNKYPGNELHWCDNDAIAIKNLIESNGDGSPNFDAIQIIDSCAKDELLRAIDKLFADNAEVALLYFSGHGSETDGGYLVTTDYTPSSLGVKMEEVLELANESKCKNKVIILDCCFAAKMGESLLVNNKTVLMILTKHGYPPTPPEIYEKVYNDILEQTENFKKYSD